MPFYDYECEDCGVFTVIRPMAEAALPTDCPECNAASGRVFLVAPAMAIMDGARRQATAINERSANAPKQSSAHGSGCSCCSPSRLKGKPGNQAAASAAAKSFPRARPWMISH